MALPEGPPYATLEDAELHHERIIGTEPTKVESVLEDAADQVAYLAPRPADVSTTLTVAMTTSQVTLQALKLDSFPDRGLVLIGSELIQFFGKTDLAGATFVAGEGLLLGLRRGRYETLPATHDVDDAVLVADYPLRARRAELNIFEWLWDTRGYRPARSGVVGSESYSTDPTEVKKIVKRIMGDYYTGGGSGGAVAFGPGFPRSRRTRPWVRSG